MKKNSTNDLVVVKENIFDRIRSFFKKIFSKKEKNINSEIKQKDEKIEENTDKNNIENTKENVENSFIETIKIKENEEEQRLTKLQSLILEDIISEDELPQEDIKALHELYDKQILDIKKQIDEYKEKILKLRMNINE